MIATSLWTFLFYAGWMLAVPTVFLLALHLVIALVSGWQRHFGGGIVGDEEEEVDYDQPSSDYGSDLDDVFGDCRPRNRIFPPANGRESTRSPSRTGRRFEL